MKKMTSLLGSAALCALLTGCASQELFNPKNDTSNTLRSQNTVSYSEYIEAAHAAAQNALTSPRMQRFLKKYAAKHGDELPVMQVALIRNDTDDTNLNQKLITDELGNALLNSGLIDVTMATGADVRSTFADVRDLQYDKNFKKSTIAKRRTLVAPSLSLEGSIISNKIKQGRTKVTVRTFNLKIVDINTGGVIWAYNKALGFKNKQGLIGW